MNDDAAAHEVRIHINRQVYHSPNPTTGEALFTLGDIPKNEALYREIEGNDEDERIVRDETPVDLVADVHFYSQEVFDILVNGDDHVIDTNRINYDRVVNLYLGSGGTPSAEYLVKYSHGPAKNPSGTLVQGLDVEVKDGMRFRVAGTGES
jgi:Multiubiquitin